MTNQIQQVRDYMNESLFEREEAIDAVLSAVIAGQHPFLLGPPGTGKTMLVSKLAECFEDASYFRTLISPTSTPSDVFGPFSLPALERGERVRETRGFLPEADFVYLDEIFKGNGATLNSLLTVINERLFSNGPETAPVPLRSVFASSNETPASDSLKALYDRFTVRLEIPYIADDDLFARLVSGDLPSPVAPKLKLSAIDDAAAAAKAVKISEAFMSNLINLRAVMQGSTEFAGLEVSDRRWKSTVGIVKARVALDGGTEVGGDDIRHTACCLWDEPEQIEVVVETLREMCSQGLKDAHLFMTEGREIAKSVQYSTERHELNKALDSFSVLLQSMGSDHPEVVRARKSVAKMAQAVQTKLNNMNRIFDLPDSPF